MFDTFERCCKEAGLKLVRYRLKGEMVDGELGRSGEYEGGYVMYVGGWGGEGLGELVDVGEVGSEVEELWKG